MTLTPPPIPASAPGFVVLDLDLPDRAPQRRYPHDPHAVEREHAAQTRL